MRKEYHIRDKEKNKSISIYGNKAIAEERFKKVKDWYTERNITLELHEVFFIGNSFHHNNKLMWCNNT